METNLLDKMLDLYRSQKTAVTIVLQNKARVWGRIAAFDSYVIVMESQKREIVYRHAISSILPSAAAEQVPPPRENKAGETRPASRPAPKAAKFPAKAPDKQKQERPAPKAAAASPEPSLNTGMKEGLLRWMQEQKAGK
jgi:host factor-I protein